jgi:hypothetical protein
MNPDIQLELPSPDPTRKPTSRQSPVRAIRWLRAALEKRGANVESLVCIAIVGVLGYAQVLPNALLVLVLLGVVLYEFEKRVDQGLPLMQVSALVAVLQWTLGSMLAYSTSLVEGRYSMYVDEATYFSYALPGTAAYVFGLLAVGSSVRQREVLRFVRREYFMTMGVVLNGIGWAAKLGAPMVPGSLAFAVHLLSQLGYVGALYFLLSRNAYRWLGVALSLFPLFKTSGDSAMFHDVLLWTGLIFCYWYGIRKHDPIAKAGLLLGAGLVMFTIQAIKQDYRAKVWSGQEASLVGQAADFWTDSGKVSDDDVLANVITRLNQGWIISAVISHVPSGEPYAEGATIRAALVAALLPRFVMQNKELSGGQQNFRRYTGLDLSEGTSMAISPLGEAYANFGRLGGIAGMLVFGLAFSSFYTFCLRCSVLHPTFLFWIPLIFYQAIKAETELVTVLNQVVKGSVVAFGLHWLIDIKGSAVMLPERQAPRRKAAGRKRMQSGGPAATPSPQRGEM